MANSHEELEFHAGDLIMKSDPWIYSLHPQFFDQYCYRCVTPFSPLPLEGDAIANASPISCSGCGIVKYCSVNCQNIDGTDRHGEECNLLKILLAHEEQPTHDILLFLKAILKIQKGQICDSEGGCLPATDRDFNRLLSHSDEIKQNPTLVGYIQKLQRSLELMLPTDPLIDTDLLTEIYGKVKINSFDIRDDYLKRIGEGLYFGPSMFNHSCQKNATFCFEGTSILIKALEGIPSMNEVQVTYCEVFTTKDLRQKSLAEWYFRCSCDLCSDAITDANLNCISCSNADCEEARPLDDRGSLACPQCGSPSSIACQRVHLANLLLEQDLHLFQKIDRLRLLYLSVTNKDSMVCLDYLQEIELLCQEILSTSKLIFHPANIMLGLTYDMLGRLYLVELDEDKYSEALQCLQKSIAPMRKILSANDPRLGLQLLILGVLQVFVLCKNLDGKAVENFAEEAERIFCVCLGSERPLTKAAKSIHLLTKQLLADIEAGYTLSEDTVTPRENAGRTARTMLPVITEALFPKMPMFSLPNNADISSSIL